MMIQVLWHKLKLWKSLVSGIVPVGLLLAVTYNTAATPTVQQISQRNPPPEIIGFTLSPSDSPMGPLKSSIKRQKLPVLIG
jgi:hypothetical protein